MRIKRTAPVLLPLLLVAIGVFAQQRATQLAPDAAKLRQHVSYLASDALDGRRTGTAGANDAAHYIAGEFARLGLHPAIHRPARKLSQAMSLYLQSFPYVAGVQLGTKNTLTFGTDQKTFPVGEDWMPLGFSVSTHLDTTPVVFVGYGITASELKHDDYADKRAAGNIALALAGTSDGDNPHGQFARYEGVRWKAVAAKNAGAKALVIISREPNLKNDRMATLSYDNSAGDAGLPVILVSQKLIGGTAAFANLENGAKQGVNSFDAQKVTASLTVDLLRQEVSAYNVIGILEGSDPLLKNETIVIGAHYDHLGRGGDGSLAPRAGEIHHGADDNASGVAGVLELARLLSSQRPKPRRTVLFIAFSGEEEGLLGSGYYVNHPIKPLANTVAMINMDMIGRMKDQKLIIGGVGTAKEWRELLNNSSIAQAATLGSSASLGTPSSGNGDSIKGSLKTNLNAATNGSTTAAEMSTKFDLTLQEDGYGPSDHSSFYAKQIPVLFFWTGTHNDYHKPSDTFDKINYTDEARILTMVARVVRQLDQADKRVSYTVAKSDSQAGRSSGFRVYLGTIPNYADSNDGLLLDGVRDDSPAAKAGLKAGDRVIKIGKHDIRNVYDYTYALGEMKAGEEYVIEIMRAGEKLALTIKPEARK